MLEPHSRFCGGGFSTCFRLITGALLACAVVSTGYAQQFVQVNPLYFTMPLRGLNPQPKTFTLTSKGPSVVWVAKAETNTGGDWLHIKYLTGCSPAIGCWTPSVNLVDVNATSLPAGTYTGVIVYKSAKTTMNVQVILTVVALGPTTLGIDRLRSAFGGGIDSDTRGPNSFKTTSYQIVSTPSLFLALVSLASVGVLFAILIRRIRQEEKTPSIIDVTRGTERPS